MTADSVCRPSWMPCFSQRARTPAARRSSKVVSALAAVSSWMSIKRTPCFAAHAMPSSSFARRPISMPIRSLNAIDSLAVRQFRRRTGYDVLTTSDRECTTVDQRQTKNKTQRGDNGRDAHFITGAAAAAGLTVPAVAGAGEISVEADRGRHPFGCRRRHRHHRAHDDGACARGVRHRTRGRESGRRQRRRGARLRAEPAARRLHDPARDADRTCSRSCRASRR